jgi:hypothetical protein
MGLRLLLVSTCKWHQYIISVVDLGAAYPLKSTFEYLLSVHLLLYRPTRNESVNDDVSCLAHSVASIHRLRVDRRVPCGVEDDHAVSTVECNAHAATLRREQEHVDALVRVESCYSRLSLPAAGNAAVDSHALKRLHVSFPSLQAQRSCRSAGVSQNNLQRSVMGAPMEKKSNKKERALTCMRSSMTRDWENIRVRCP